MRGKLVIIAQATIRSIRARGKLDLGTKRWADRVDLAAG